MTEKNIDLEEGKKYRVSTIDGFFIDLEILMVKDGVVKYQRPNGTIDTTELETINRLRRKEISEGVNIMDNQESIVSSTITKQYEDRIYELEKHNEWLQKKVDEVYDDEDCEFFICPNCGRIKIGQWLIYLPQYIY